MQHGGRVLNVIFLSGMILLGALSPSNVFCGENIQTNAEELLLYRVDDNYKFLLDGRIPIDKALSAQKKLRVLLDEISHRHYSDLPPIEILKTLKTKDGFVVVLNLKEDEQDFFKSKWYQIFQGSLGWAQAYFQLIYTPLQPDYPGFWFSGVKVFWNGKPIDMEDTDIGLSKITLRSEMRERNCLVGDEC